VHAICHEQSAPRRDLLALLGWINSLTCDWWARRFVDRHITAPIINNLRLPEWDEDDRQRIATLVSELLARRDPDTEFSIGLVPERGHLSGSTEIELLADLEVAAIRGIGLDKSSLEVILDDFSENGCPPELRTLIRSQLEA
jgi:hypothetical protein